VGLSAIQPHNRKASLILALVSCSDTLGGRYISLELLGFFPAYTALLRCATLDYGDFAAVARESLLHYDDSLATVI
jgi:hypothetical protein